MGALLALAHASLAVFQLAALYAGIEVWLDLEMLPTIVISIAIVAVSMMIGPLGSFAVLVGAFFGAMDGWDWQWWQAALLCFPFAILQGATILGVGGASMFSRDATRY